MDMLANSLSVMDLGRPAMDRTGLSGRYDFVIEWAPGTGGAAADAGALPDLPGPTNLQALRDELGLKVESTTGAVKIPIVDRVERPTEN